MGKHPDKRHADEEEEEEEAPAAKTGKGKKRIRFEENVEVKTFHKGGKSHF